MENEQWIGFYQSYSTNLGLSTLCSNPNYLLESFPHVVVLFLQLYQFLSHHWDYISNIAKFVGRVFMAKILPDYLCTMQPLCCHFLCSARAPSQHFIHPTPATHSTATSFWS